MSITQKPLSSLQLTGFDMYTRASYFAKFGKPAPPADPARRAKAWVGFGTFYFFRDGKLVQETVPPSENLPNLEGFGPTTPYVIPPSGAWQTLNGERTTKYNPLYLSLQADAQILMAQLGGTGLFDASENQFSPLSYDPEEKRREWEFTDSKGVVVNAGVLLFMNNSQGIGAAGHWNQDGSSPVWVRENPTPDMSQPPWTAPCRALAANEKIGPPDFSGLPVILVDDGQPDQNSTTASGGSFTQGDRNQLTSIAQELSTVLQIVQQLAAK